MTVTKRNYNGTLSRNYFFAIALGDFSVDFLSSWDNSFFCSSGLLYESCESWVFRPKPEVEKIKVLRRFSQTVQVGPVETFLMANCIGKSSPISLLFLFSCESFFVENSFFLEIEIAFYFSSITGIRLIHDWWINIARRINKMVSIYVYGFPIIKSSMNDFRLLRNCPSIFYLSFFLGLNSSAIRLREWVEMWEWKRIG